MFLFPIFFFIPFASSNFCLLSSWTFFLIFIFFYFLISSFLFSFLIYFFLFYIFLVFLVNFSSLFLCPLFPLFSLPSSKTLVIFSIHYSAFKSAFKKYNSKTIFVLIPNNKQNDHLYFCSFTTIDPFSDFQTSIPWSLN